MATHNLTTFDAPIVELPWRGWMAMEYEPSVWGHNMIHNRTERFLIGCTTRQCGKTTTSAGQIWAELTRPNHPIFGAPWVGVVSYDYEHAEMLVFRFLDAAFAAFGADAFEVNLNKRRIKLKATGATLSWHSSDHPASLAGPTFSTVFIDEAQLVVDEAWNKLRPTLNVRKARVIATGTPDLAPDQTWFHGLYLRGQVGEDPEYHSFTITCWDNPWITYEEIKDARGTMSIDEFRMLMLGQWLDVDGRVFKKFSHCFRGDWEAYDPTAGPYIIGVDVALKHDYTVAYVFDMRRRAVVKRWRASGLDPADIRDAVKALRVEYNAMYVVMDATGQGLPIARDLRRESTAGAGDAVPVVDFVFGERSKKALVGTLMRMLELGELTLPREDTQLYRELEVFQRKVSKSGDSVKYSHPVNFFDDCVMALGMCAVKADEGDWGRPPSPADDTWIDMPGEEVMVPVPPELYETAMAARATYEDALEWLERGTSR
jgi:hypothetical protein